MPKTLAYLLGKGGQDMPLTLRERQSVIRELAARYACASRKEKSQLIVQLTELTGYVRSYAARVLRKPPRLGQPRRPHGKRGLVYGPPVIEALRKVWLILDCISGKRLAPFLAEIVPILERHGELRLDDDTRKKLLSMSAATIDRRLAQDRRRLDIKGRSGTKPGTLLKHNIPIKTFSEWSDTEPGFVEIDLVGHDGGNTRGEYAQTLDVVDVATRWTETRAVKNKAQKWVFEALKHIIARIPFPVRGIDSDNGAEFINDHLIRFCAQNRITFTRSRAYNKNDSCYVEQKNWSVVRRTVGYARYTTDAQVLLLNEIYETLRLYTNYFQPVMVLTAKERKGSKVTKHYDAPKTPYQRVMASACVSQEVKDRLTTEYQTLNPARLKRRLLALTRLLLKSCSPDVEARSASEKHPSSEEGGMPHAANYTT
ncbi:MAG: transposase family protein [Bacillota bacterium]|nr:transposase family protein [Bacillota bacterium]